MSEHDSQRQAADVNPLREVIANQTVTADTEPTIYEEPTRLGWQDKLGVVAALIALAVIGVAGYIWLTPGLEFDTLLARLEAARQPAPQAASPQSASASDAAGTKASASAVSPSAMPGMVEHEQGMVSANSGATDGNNPQANTVPSSNGSQTEPVATADDPLAGVNLIVGDTDCATCGMSGPASGSHCVALWNDGARTHHDCWDCLFTYGKERGLSLVRAVVIAHGGGQESPRWLEASRAWFLYGTSRIEMSMPPYVAAFASRAAAEAAQPELGGELLDFAGLQAHWE